VVDCSQEKLEESRLISRETRRELTHLKRNTKRVDSLLNSGLFARDSDTCSSIKSNCKSSISDDDR
jgi:hypothetical protein